MKRLGVCVQYHGIDIVITMPYVAVDANGYLCEYGEEPIISGAIPAWGGYGVFNKLCEVDLEGMDFKETLLRFNLPTEKENKE